MTKLAELRQMRDIVQAQYDQKQQHFQKLIAREGHLRAELDRLSAMALDTGGPDMALQSIGADILWRGWVGRMKTQLNMELAQILAMKEYYLSDVRKAYGKVMVVQELIKTTQKKARKVAADKALNTVIEQHLLTKGV